MFKNVFARSALLSILCIFLPSLLYRVLLINSTSPQTDAGDFFIVLTGVLVWQLAAALIFFGIYYAWKRSFRLISILNILLSVILSQIVYFIFLVLFIRLAPIHTLYYDFSSLSLWAISIVISTIFIRFSDKETIPPSVAIIFSIISNIIMFFMFFVKGLD